MSGDFSNKLGDFLIRNINGARDPQSFIEKYILFLELGLIRPLKEEKINRVLERSVLICQMENHCY